MDLELIYKKDYSIKPLNPVDILLPTTNAQTLVVCIDMVGAKATWKNAGKVSQLYIGTNNAITESTPKSVDLGQPTEIPIVPFGSLKLRYYPNQWITRFSISIYTRPVEIPSHTHSINQIDGLTDLLVTPSVGSVTGLQTALDGKASTVHAHGIVDVTGLQTALDGKASTVHTHGISDVTGLQTALDGKASTVHAHGISDVTGLQSALDGKALSVHAHGIVDVTGLQTALDGKASNVLWMPFVHGGSLGIRFTANSADPTYCFALPIGATIVSLVINGAVSTLNNSTNYWRWGGVSTPAIRHGNGGANLHSFSASDFSTATWAINTAAQIEIPVNKVASFGFFDVRPAQWIRVGSPGELFLGMGVRYRL